MSNNLKFYIDGAWVDPDRAPHPRRDQPRHRRIRGAGSAWAGPPTWTAR